MDFDILIVGAGLAGASLAAALRGTSLRLGVIETRPPKAAADWDARIYAISPSNATFLSKIGAWEHLDHDRIAPVYDMQIRGDDGGRIDFSSYDSGLGELAWIVESGLMQRELWEIIKRQHNVKLLCPAVPASLARDDEKSSIFLEDGRRLDARLIVGADGVQSWVRDRAGIEARFSPYGEKGVVANFECEKPHHGTAFQWFRKDGVLAWLPLPGKRISIVWSAPDEIADELVALQPSGLASRVAEAGDTLLGELHALGQAQAFPLRLMRVDSPVSQRLVLIGDAAHAIHPLSGHGINLGYQDAQKLSEKLAALPGWRDPGDIETLRSYARARAEETALLQYTTHGLNRLFKPANPLVSGLRNLGMNLTNRMPVLRNALVRYAVSGKF